MSAGKAILIFLVLMLLWEGVRILDEILWELRENTRRVKPAVGKVDSNE